MTIEKVNDNQIRCTLDRADLISRNIKISELEYGSEKAKNLFREMMQHAALDFGFEVGDSPLMIEAVPLNSDQFLILITKVEDPEELDTRFSKFAPSLIEDEEDAERDEDDDYGDDFIFSEDSASGENMNAMNAFDAFDAFNAFRETGDHSSGSASDANSDLNSDASRPAVGGAVAPLTEGVSFSEFIKKSLEAMSADSSSSGSSPASFQSAKRSGKNSGEDHNVGHSGNRYENPADNSTGDSASGNNVHSDESGARSGDISSVKTHTKPADTNHYAAFYFSHLNDLVALSGRINAEGSLSSLYKDEASGEYILVISKKSMDLILFLKICTLFSEYGRMKTIGASALSYYNEHYRIIIAGDALGGLSIK